MREHPEKFAQALEVAWIVGPIVVFLVLLRVRYLRGHGVRTTGVALSTRTEARSRPRTNGRSGWETYYVTVTLVDYTDHEGRRHQREIEGRHRPGSPVALVYPARRPHRAEPASAASYARVLWAALGVVVVIVALGYMRDQVAQDVGNFCGGQDAAGRAFHDCP